MRSFNFRLEESLHQDLKALAQAEGASMAALCREALALYVERQKAELGMPPCPQVRHQAGWAPTAVQIDPEGGWGPQWCSRPQQPHKRHRTSLADEPLEPELEPVNSEK
jgi:hypothetical protein